MSSSDTTTTTSAASSAKEENQRVLEALRRLETACTNLQYSKSAPTLSHWRQLPQDVTEAYQVMTSGGQLVEHTATKYTLLSKADALEGSKLAKDLLQGCQHVATGALVLCTDDSGCCSSVRSYARQYARAVVVTCIQLIECLMAKEENNMSKHDGGAPKTGAVWSACQKLTKIPKGNRTSMRRDLLTWIVECNETMEEFQQVIDLGAAAASDDNGNNKQDEDETTWGDFMDGQIEQYSTMELPIATACVALIKCSRGAINVTLKTCECVGEQVDGNDATTTIEEEQGADRLAFISKLHDLARAVGENMTDLGALLYPPLGLKAAANDKESTTCHLAKQVRQQTDKILAVLELILDSAPIELEEDIVEMATKLKAAASTRCQDAQSAIATALDSK